MVSRAAIVTVGSELVEGLRVDTNTAEVAREVARRGFEIIEAVSIADDVRRLAHTLRRLMGETELVIVTGGLGPTHDDITRDAASLATGAGLGIDAALVEFLKPVVERHADPKARESVFTQALVLEGADVLFPTTGTAAGQLLARAGGTLVLLPGPPAEMRPMLRSALARYEETRAGPIEIGVSGMPESDVQQAAQRVLSGYSGIELAVLARPGDVHAVLFDEGAGEATLARAAASICDELGPACYSTNGSTLAEVVIGEAVQHRVTLAAAESCTGGMVAAALTDVAGSSAAFLGSAVTYSNAAKTSLLGVAPRTIETFGAVSEETAREMAEGARTVFAADVAVAVTGIAGPTGGSAEKPVGLVWFAVATSEGVYATERRGLGSARTAVRARATSIALQLLRREVARR